VNVHETHRWEGSAESYLSYTMTGVSESFRKAGTPLRNERSLLQGRDTIFVWEYFGKTFFHMARKAPSGRILHLTVSTDDVGNRSEVATVEKAVVEILAPSFVALR
jgi:hypothetical protein